MPASDTEAEASEWLIRLETDPAPELKAEFEQWLAADARNRAAYVRLEKTWRRADLVRRLRPLDGAVDENIIDKFGEPDAIVSASGTIAGEPGAIAGEPGGTVGEPGGTVGELGGTVGEPGGIVGAPGALAGEPGGNVGEPGAVAGEPGGIVGAPDRKPWLPWVAAAAAAALAVAAGSYGWISHSRAGWQAYRTEPGGFQRVALSDGSFAFLNTASQIRVKMTADRRKIVLERGEALFTVAHDPQRPFDVTAADTVVRAVGTQFSVRLGDQQEVDVIVKEGRVAIDPPDDFVEPKLAQQSVSIPKLSTLVAGESVSVMSRKLVVRKVPAEDMTRKLAWTQGRLWFDRVMLVEAVAEFNRYNRRQIVIDDPSIQSLHVAGTFDTQDLESFLAALRAYGVHADSTSSGPDGAAEIIRLSGSGQAKH